MTDYDGAWKEALELFFPLFVRLLFPELYEDIEWERGYESLETELQQLMAQAEVGKRTADKLFRVYLSSWRRRSRCRM